jgi:indole-3-glycerol phosphate synthase
MTNTERPLARTYLDEILAHKAREVEERFANIDVASLRRTAGRRSDHLSLYNAIKRPGIQVIAEIKRRSPSKGEFRRELDPAAIAGEYLAGGAAAISVLTDKRFFGGSMADLVRVYGSSARSGGLVLLRKDFIIDERQVIESAAWGADAFLLIVAAIPPSELKALHTLADDLGLEALVEVHDESELTTALDSGAKVIGVNNRDLRSFETDLRIAEHLLPLVPQDIGRVAESGISARHDVERMAAAGADAVLVGETLMKSGYIRAKLRELRGC